MFKALKNLFGNTKAKKIVNQVRPKLEGLETRETPSSVVPSWRDNGGSLNFGSLIQNVSSRGVRVAGNMNSVLVYEREQPVRPTNQFQSNEWNYQNRMQAVQAAQPVVKQTNALTAAQARMNALLRHSGNLR